MTPTYPPHPLPACSSCGSTNVVAVNALSRTLSQGWDGTVACRTCGSINYSQAGTQPQAELRSRQPSARLDNLLADELRALRSGALPLEVVACACRVLNVTLTHAQMEGLTRRVGVWQGIPCSHARMAELLVDWCWA